MAEPILRAVPDEHGELQEITQEVLETRIVQVEDENRRLLRHAKKDAWLIGQLERDKQADAEAEELWPLGLRLFLYHGKVFNRTSGKSFAIIPLPKARQAIIDAGGLIPYTRKLMLAAGAGSKIIVIADGDDADRAIAELEKLLLIEDIDEFVI